MREKVADERHLQRVLKSLYGREGKGRNKTKQNKKKKKKRVFSCLRLTCSKERAEKKKAKGRRAIRTWEMFLKGDEKE